MVILYSTWLDSFWLDSFASLRYPSEMMFCGPVHLTRRLRSDYGRWLGILHAGMHVVKFSYCTRRPRDLRPRSSTTFPYLARSSCSLYILNRPTHGITAGTDMTWLEILVCANEIPDVVNDVLQEEASEGDWHGVGGSTRRDQNRKRPKIVSDILPLRRFVGANATHIFPKNNILGLVFPIGCFSGQLLLDCWFCVFILLFLWLKLL